MASYYSELDTKEREESHDEDSAGRRGRWVNQVVGSFLDVSRSAQGTPVSTMASPENYLGVARMFGEFMDNEQTGTEHRQFLENLIMRLTEEANSGAVGPPPASREFIRTLPVLPADQCKGKVYKHSTVVLVLTDGCVDVSCVICNETFGGYEPVTCLPCKHHFHRECVKPWLELHNTCPMCRHEVPSDDPRWLEKKREADRLATAEVRDMMLYG